MSKRYVAAIDQGHDDAGSAGGAEIGTGVAVGPDNAIAVSGFVSGPSNLDAFVRKLQLLGCFQSLSDDFSAQFVNRPREAAA